MGKKTLSLKNKPQIFTVFHIPVGFHATQSVCPGVLLTSAMGVAAELHSKNPEKVSLPLALHVVYLYTYNDHHSQWRVLW